MPTSMTYNSLFADLQSYLERGGSATGDPTVFQQIPRLINGAERKLAQVLKLLGQKEVLRDATGLQANNPILTKPDRWRKTASLKIGVGIGNAEIKMLFPRELEYAQSFWPNVSLTDEPEFYSDYDLQHYFITPTPDAVYPIEFVAYMQPPLLDAANQTNFWTNFCSNGLLYGSLLEAVPFLGSDARIPTWQNYWQLELVGLGAQDLQRMLDQTSERTGP